MPRTNAPRMFVICVTWFGIGREERRACTEGVPLYRVLGGNNWVGHVTNHWI